MKVVITRSKQYHDDEPPVGLGETLQEVHYKVKKLGTSKEWILEISLLEELTNILKDEKYSACSWILSAAEYIEAPFHINFYDEEAKASKKASKQT